MSGYGSAGKLYFLSLLVKQLGPWIECVFRGNHEVHRVNKVLFLVSFFLTAADLLQVTVAFVLKIFSFSDREKSLGNAFDRHCWVAACCSTHVSSWWPAKLKF